MLSSPWHFVKGIRAPSGENGLEQPVLFEGVSCPHPDRVDRVSVKKSAHQAVVDGWTRLWKERHHVDWVWTGRDLQAVKRLLKIKDMTVEAILARARSLVFNPPTSWYEAEASPALLAGHWNNPRLFAQAPGRPVLLVPKCLRCRQVIQLGLIKQRLFQST